MRTQLLVAFFSFQLTLAFAQSVPSLMSYQGLMTNAAGEVVANGPHTVKFSFYDAATDGNLKWETPIIPVNTVKGLFTTTIQIPQNATWDQSLFVEIRADNVVMNSRVQLTTVPYAFKAVSASVALSMNASGLTGTVDDARLSTHLQDLADGSLSGEKVGSGINALSVTTGILRNEVLDSDLQDLASDGILSASKIENLDASKITTGVLDPARIPVTGSRDIDASEITSGTLDPARLPAGGTGALDPDLEDLADGSLTGSKVGAGIPAENLSGTIANANLDADLQDLAVDGVLQASRVENLDASKISSGVFNAARIPELDASKITSGIISADRLPTSVSPGGSGVTNQLAFWSAANTLAADGVSWDPGQKEIGLGTSDPSAKFHVTQNDTHNPSDAVKIESNVSNVNAGTTEVRGLTATMTSGATLTVSTSAINAQVLGSANQPHYGVYTDVKSTGAGINVGVRGLTQGAGTGTKYGVWGESLQGGATKYGVYGSASGTGTNHYGVYGSASGATNTIGVYGIASTIGSFGVYGASSASSGYGVYGYASQINSYGLYGNATATGSHALWAQGNARITGNLTVDGTFNANIDAAKITSGILPISIGGTGAGTDSPVNQNLVFASPSVGGSGSPSFRTLTTSDLPISVATVSGTPTTGNIAYWTGSNQLGSDGLVWDASDNELSIGSATPGASLHVVHDNTRPSATSMLVDNAKSINNKKGINVLLSANTGEATGIDITVEAGNSTGARYGIKADVTSFAGGNNLAAGISSAVAGAAAWPHYGIYSTAGGSGEKQYGIYGFASGAGNFQKTGVYGTAVNTGGNGDLIGVQAEIPSYASGANNKYGIKASADGDGGNKYGIHAYVTGTGSSFHTAIYAQANGATTNNYGVYTTATGSGSYALWAAGAAHVTGALTVGGSINATGNIFGANFPSDRKLKSNIVPMGASLSKILALNPVNYHFRKKEFARLILEEDKQYGLIAQDVEKIFPELVMDKTMKEEKDESGKIIEPEFSYKSLDYTSLIPILIKGMQEQQAMIDELKKEVKSLKAENQKQQSDKRFVKASLNK